MPAFEFPDFTLIAYGKTGSTSLTDLADQQPDQYPHIVKTENGHVWEPVKGANWEQIPANKPVYLVMRPPEDRLLSGIQMFLQVRYCDELIVHKDLSYKWAHMMPEPNAYKGHFLRTLKELWSTEEFWSTQIPHIFCMFRNELFNPHSRLAEYLRSEPGGITAEQAEHRQKELFWWYGIAGDYHKNWQDFFTDRLQEERYHMGNYLTYLDTNRLSGWIPLKELTLWGQQYSYLNSPGHSISQHNSNKSRSFNIAPGTLWSVQEQENIKIAMRNGIKYSNIWWLWQRYIQLDNTAYNNIQKQVPKLGLEPAAKQYTPPDITSNQ